MDKPEGVENEGRDIDATESRRHEDEEASAWPKIAAVGVLLIGGIVALLLTTNAGSAFNYTEALGDVVAQPSTFAGRPLRVEGDLRTGSIRFQEEPCEWRFTIDQEGASMPVRFPECVVPDTFQDRPGVIVTVQGTVHGEGDDMHFLATELVPRCPSKYDPSTHEMPEGEGGNDPLALPNDPV